MSLVLSEYLYGASYSEFLPAFSGISFVAVICLYTGYGGGYDFTSVLTGANFLKRIRR